MQLIRTFHPVGQGAFYSEEFFQDNQRVFCVVYDCGCIHRTSSEKNGREVVRKWIGKMGEKKIVDYLFVSHFDYDHVSLLDVFKEECVIVKKVVLPLLSDDKQFLSEIQDVLFADAGTGVCSRLIVDARKYFGSETKIISVLPYKQGDARENGEPYDGHSQVVKSGTRFGVPSKNDNIMWCYAVFNYDDERQRIKLLNLFSDPVNGFGSQFDPKCLSNFSLLIQQYEKGRAFSIIKKIYGKLDGGINLNSMVIYSVPCVEDARLNMLGTAAVNFGLDSRCLLSSIIHGKEHRPYLPGCLYTGDVDLRTAPIKDWGACYLCRIGTIQVAHHGSSYSFDEELFVAGGFFCPISCSIEKPYGHPHGNVVASLALMGNFPVCITEEVYLVQTIFLGDG